MIQTTFDLVPEDRKPAGGMVRELSVRYLPTGIVTSHRSLNRPEAVVEFITGPIRALGRPDQEAFWVLPCNRRNRAIGVHLLTLGTVNATLAHPREILRVAIAAAASAFVCVHNHPSGDPAPSAADLAVTRQIREAARAVDIEFTDHVIIGRAEEDPLGKGFYSFRAAGII
jgi:DNA repair protein RadC